ncbi:sigma-54-dependent transcriptional regulator [Desulfurivibrio alkaliphilus]|uniref:Two component, sigma54 specific, transcriptional regulator, Fis family n=1 Tax=Desulfurivibrio alkaliphilus (strain DSM 19089 / UNIQEM U267 / AHT2) TaxID=589865 RepID=D6Z0L6_DESAT|nr:sigma-54 dependent transcriptional regulator [Desulfurivibrio alkaliphilus]ADH85245.1 two component, sigma54 specific, transcriptional regulator, Fis family [Desulfurivibrio alkaliphilus AHT 2]
MTAQTAEVNILVVDDDEAHRYMLRAMLAEWGWRSAEAADGALAVAAVAEQPFDAVLMDVRMARMDGMEALRRIQAHNPAIPVIIMTAYSSVDSAVEAMKAGARDYLTKPLDFDRLRLTLAKALDHRQVEESRRSRRHDDPADQLDQAGIIGNSPAMKELLEMITYVAPTEATVLISGESGTGKELVATALHRNSTRKDGPLVKVNCAALVESLLESELFGHEKGAFTGADRRREGKFIQAASGTIFLDEISETSPAMQAKLLRVLQEHEIQRVGGQETLKVDVRVLAASNRVLEDAVKEGKFREDLYYRLNVVTLQVPPLRERSEDIPLLAAHFVDKFAARNRRRVEGITPQAMDLLLKHPWPGNVRELENAIERGVILMRGDYLDEQSLPLSLRRIADEAGAPPAESTTGRPSSPSSPSSLEEAEKLVVRRTLEETGGNRSEAARRLNITRKTLLSKINKYGLG